MRCAGRGRIVLLVAAVGVAPSPAVVAEASPPAVEDALAGRLASAAALLARGDAVAAEASYRRLIGEAPRLAEARQGLARSLAALGRRREASALLLELAAGTGGQQAVGYAAEAVELEPESSAAQLALGRALLLEQRFTAALAPLARAAEAAAGEPTPHLYYGLALWECGRIELARESLERAVELSRRDRVSIHQLARLHLWAGRPEQALPLLREAVAGSPSVSIDLWLDFAQALERTGDDDEALAVLRRLEQLAPQAEAIRYGLARLLLGRGETQAAREQLATFERLRAERTANQTSEGRERARLDFGWNLLAAGRAADAAAHFGSLAETAERWAGLAEARKRLGDLSGAITALEHAVTLAPERQDLRLLLAEARQSAGGDSEP